MRKETIIIVGSLLGAGLIVFLLVIPAWDSLGSTKEELSQQQARLTEIQGIVVKIKELDEKYQGNIEDLKKLTELLPNKEELPSLLIQLESLASASGLVMEEVDFSEVNKQKVAAWSSNVSPQPEEIVPKKMNVDESLTQTDTSQETQVELEPYKILLVNLQLSGGYGSFKGYLKSLEKNLRLMDIVSINFSTKLGQQTAQAAQPNFTFQANVNVYYQ